MENKTLTQRFAHSYIEFAARNRRILLAVILTMLVTAIYIISTQLKINTDLASLLPRSTPSVLALEESNERFGSTDKFMVAIQSEDPHTVAALQHDIQQELLSQWSDILVTATIDNENKFFQENALLYLPVSHLERIKDNLEDIQFELGRSNLPFVIDLLGDSEVEKAERVWFDASIPQELGLPDEAADAFADFFAAQNKEETTEWNPKQNLPGHLKSRLIGQLAPPQVAFNGVIQCKLTKPSTDINFAELVTLRADTLLQKYRAKKYDAPFRLSIEGTYESLKEVEDLKSDSNLSLLISAFLIFALVIWFFSPNPPTPRFKIQFFKDFYHWLRQGIVAPILLSLQVGFACVLMLAFTALWYGYLNPFTLFVASIIMGMGIDYAIHFMGNCQIQQAQSPDLKDALKKTIEHLLRPMTLAALTTVSGLLTLLFAHFTGFYEFGVIAAVGITLSVASALFAMPVMILTLKGLPPSPDRRIVPRSWSNRDLNRILHRVGIAVLVLTIPLLFMSQFTEFEHDFQKLRRPNRENTDRIRTGVAQGGKRTTSTPAVVMGDNPAQLDQLYDTLMVRLHKEKDPYLRSFLTLKTFVPSPEDQQERLELIRDIRELAEARVFDRATGTDSTNIALLRKFAAIDAPFTVTDLPAWSVDMLREKDGTYGNIGFIYGKFRGGDAREIAKFQERYSHWNFGGNDLRVFSSQFIISDVVKVVKADSIVMAVLIIGVIFLILLFSLRKPRLVAVSSASLLMGVLWTVGFMGLFTYWFDVCKLGIYNIIVIPTIIGVGIDATIYMLIAWVDTYRHKGGLTALYNNMGKMVMASTTTTIAGFGGVLFITHRGMRTIGEVAVLGLFLFLCASQIFIPWLAHKLFPPTNPDAE